MIVHDSKPTPCPHCGLEARLRTLHTHGGVRYDICCGMCGNSTRGSHGRPERAIEEYAGITPHFHKIGMGYFLNEEEGAAYVFRPVDTQNHRKCMEILQEGYENMMLSFDFCPDCGFDNRYIVSNLKESFKEPT